MHKIFVDFWCLGSHHRCEMSGFKAAVKRFAWDEVQGEMAKFKIIVAIDRWAEGRVILDEREARAACIAFNDAHQNQLRSREERAAGQCEWQQAVAKFRAAAAVWNVPV